MIQTTFLKKHHKVAGFLSFLLSCPLICTPTFAHPHGRGEVPHKVTVAKVVKPAGKQLVKSAVKPVVKSTAKTERLPSAKPSLAAPSKTTLQTVSSQAAPKFSREVRVGDLAPDFSLNDPQGRIFSPIEELGQRSIFLIVTGDAVSLSDAQKSGGLTTFMRQLSDAASQRREDTLRIVLATSNANDWSQIKASPRVLPNLTPVFDAKRTLQQIYNVSQKEIAIVAIDRAGFIRKLQTAFNRADLKLRLLPLQDPTLDSFQNLRVGALAPDFSLCDAQGQWRRLADLRGHKNLLLTFFPKCFTGNCTNHLTSIQASYNELLKADTEVWAVSVDEAEGERGQRAFQEKLSLQFPLVPDPNRNLCLLYGAAYSTAQLATRMSVFIDKNGVVRWVDKQINIKTHGADVLEKVEALKLNH